MLNRSERVDSLFIRNIKNIKSIELLYWESMRGKNSLISSWRDVIPIYPRVVFRGM